MKFLRKCIAVICAVVLCISSIVPAGLVETSAANPVTLTVETIQGHKGDTVTVNVNVSNNTGIAGATFKLSYDTTKLELISADEVYPFVGCSINTDVKGVVSYAYVGAKAKTDNGAICALEFKVLENTTIGDAAIAITENKMTDDTMKPFVATVVNGKVSVACTHSNIEKKLMSAATSTTSGYYALICKDCSVTVGTETIPATGNSKNIKLLVDSVNASAGDTIDVNVSVSDNPGIASLIFSVDYDSQKLTLISAEEVGPYYSTAVNTNVDGKISYAFMQAKAISNNGAVLHMKYKVAENIGYGETAIRLESVQATDATPSYVDVATTNGVVGIMCSHTNTTANVTKAATCETTGTKVTTCNACKEVVKTETIAATGHVSTKKVVAKAATCEEAGSYNLVCNACGKVAGTEVIPATGHTNTKNNVTEATCTNPGVTSVVCSTCGKTVSVSQLAAKGHGTTHKVLVKDAKCEETGLYNLVCDVCNQVAGTEIIPAKGHVNTKITVVEPTCTTAGSRTNKCLDCNKILSTETIAAKGHGTTHKVVGKAATATTAGYYNVICDVCDEVVSTETIAALGNPDKIKVFISKVDGKPGETVTVKFSVADNPGINALRLYIDYDKNVLEYVEDDVVYPFIQTTINTEKAGRIGYLYVDPRARSNNGDIWYVKFKISDNASVGESPIDVSFSEVVTEDADKKPVKTDGIIYAGAVNVLCVHNTTSSAVTKAPTCEEKGVRTYTCSTCGAVTKTESIAATGHGTTKKVLATAATCEAAGLYNLVCNTCKKVAGTEVIPATGHGTTTKQLAKTATCEETGLYNLVCNNCKTVAGTEIIQAKGHGTTRTQDTKATCTAAGKTETICNDCNKVIATVTTPATGHGATSRVVSKEATCEGTGTYNNVCSVCKQVASTGIIPAKGHGTTKKVLATAAKCETAGSYNIVCNDCNKTINTEVIPATGHLNTKQNVKAATCTAAGSIDTVCSDCGKTIASETIAATGHIETTKTLAKAATCEVAGSYNYVCKVCGQVAKTEAIPATGHIHTTTSTTEATCTKAGSIVITCTDCKKVIDTKTIAAKGHGATKKVVAQAATCETAGSYNIVCTVCNATVSTEAIAATGHVHTSKVLVKEATKEATGLYNIVCDDCHKVVGTEVIPKLTDFLYGDINNDGKVNSTDAVLLKQYLAGYDITINLNAADVYKDGKINSSDSVMLMQYLAGYDVILGASR